MAMLSLSNERGDRFNRTFRGTLILCKLLNNEMRADNIIAISFDNNILTQIKLSYLNTSNV